MTSARFRLPAPAAWVTRTLAALSLAMLTVPPLARAELINRIVATVDGDPITLHELQEYGERTIRGRQLSAVTNQEAVLDALITDRIIQKEVSDRGIIVRDEEVDRYIETIKARNELDDAQLQTALAAQGVTIEGYRAQIREEIEREQLVSRDIRGKVNVTPEEVERYYRAHLSEFSTPARVQVAHILLQLPQDAPPDQVAAVTAKAQSIYARYRKGDEFADLARQYSEDASGEKGGVLGWFTQGELFDELEKVAARLKVGEVSEPVRTRIGVHLITVTGREEAAPEKLDALADQIREKLYNAALEERFQKWLTEELRKKHHVEIQ